jgi:type IV fimbrial biogenesis protein FimT
MPIPDSRSVNYRKSRGFTLAELMVTIVIAGVFAAIAVPSYRSFVARQRIRTASFDIMAMLTFARSEAIKRNTSVDVNPSSGNWKNGWTITVGGTTLSQQSALSGLTVSCKSGGAVVTPCPTITYNNNGRTSGTTSIELSSTSTDSSGTRCISTSLSGLPRSKKASCS